MTTNKLTNATLRLVAGLAAATGFLAGRQTKNWWPEDGGRPR